MSLYDRLLGPTLQAEQRLASFGPPPGPNSLDKFATAVVAIATVLGVTNVGPPWLRETATWISYLFPVALVLLLWRTITPYYQRYSAWRREQAEKHQRALALQRSAEAMERVIALIQERLSDAHHRDSALIGLVQRISMNTAPERRIAVNARKEPFRELCDLLNQVRKRVEVQEAELTGRIINYCVLRALERLPALISVLAEPATMDDCERLRSLTNDFVTTYNNRVEKVREAGLGLVDPLPTYVMLHAPTKASPL